jgi:hypothetical protein
MSTMTTPAKSLSGRRAYIADCKAFYLGFRKLVNDQIINQYSWKLSSKSHRESTKIGLSYVFPYEKTGVVVAFYKDDQLYVGWSKCRLGEDKFEKYIGLRKAIERAAVFPTYVGTIYEAMPDYKLITNSHLFDHCPFGLCEIALRNWKYADHKFRLKEPKAKKSVYDPAYIDTTYVDFVAASNCYTFAVEDDVDSPKHSE